MGMAVISGLVSGLGFWRAGSGSGAITLHRICWCPCAAFLSIGMHSLPACPQQQRHIGVSRDMRSHLVSKLAFGSERGFFTGPNWNFTVQLSRAREQLVANGGRLGCTRTMASSKRQEEPRGSLWRTRSVISKETVQTVHDLKRNKDSSVELDKVFQSRVPRLLKMDLLATLSELQRQNEIDLALRVFDIVRKEIWYKPDQFLYRSMMDALGRNRRIPDVEKKFQELQDEGIRPEVAIYRELVGAYVRAHMLPEALAMHEQMVENGCGDDRLALQFIETAKEKEAVRLKQRKKAADKLKAGQEEASPSKIDTDNERELVNQSQAVI